MYRSLLGLNEGLTGSRAASLLASQTIHQGPDCLQELCICDEGEQFFHSGFPPLHGRERSGEKQHGVQFDPVVGWQCLKSSHLLDCVVLAYAFCERVCFTVVNSLFSKKQTNEEKLQHYLMWTT